MNTNDKGGPAFPQHPDMPSQLGCISSESDAGMTLRDYFAAAAMQSLIVVYHDDKNLVSDYAQRAFEIADSMLEERK